MSKKEALLQQKKNITGSNKRSIYDGSKSIQKNMSWTRSCINQMKEVWGNHHPNDVNPPMSTFALLNNTCYSVELKKDQNDILFPNHQVPSIFRGCTFRTNYSKICLCFRCIRIATILYFSWMPDTAAILLSLKHPNSF